jgi:hypothetical protein
MDAVARANDCTSALQNAVGALASDETWSQIATYLEQVTPQVEGLRNHLERSRAVGSAPSLPHLQRVRAALDQVRETFNSQPDQLGQGEAAGLLRSAVTDALIDHRNRANDEWSRLRESALDEAPDGLLRLYWAIPDARDGAEKASALRARIASANKAPAEIEELAAFKQSVDLLRHLLDELRSVALPPEVERFLENALRGDARWAELTSGVVEWLSEHNMLQTLRVKIV